METIKIIFKTIIISILSIIIGCTKNSTEPLSNTEFNVIIHYGENPDGSLAKKADHDHGSKKLSGIQKYDMARIMVLDFSKYGNWEGFLRSADATEYYADLDAWSGNRDSWAEWRGFLGNYFIIVCDQTLDIGEELATGTVTGAIGHNHFFMAFTNGDIIEFQGEGSADGVAGETQEVNIFVTEWGVDDGSDNWNDWWYDIPPDYGQY